MGNGVFPANAPGTSRFFWCCNVESDSGSIVSIMDSKTDEASASSMRPRPLPLVTSSAKADDIGTRPKNSDDTDAKKSNTEVDDAEATTADTATPARTTPPSESPAKDSAVAGFAGSWLCVAVTGNMEAFLTDMGVSEGPRKAASVARYGALRQVQNITQSGDSFVVENILDKPVTMRFVVGEGVQKTTDQEGSTIFIEPVWDGEALCVSSKRDSGELIALSRRYLESADMILELQSPKGTVVRRIFQRRLIFPPG